MNPHHFSLTMKTNSYRFIAKLICFAARYHLSSFPVTICRQGWKWAMCTNCRLVLSSKQTDLYIVHWFGFGFDLTVGFLMLLEPTRLPAMLFCTAFHFMNSRLFSIGNDILRKDAQFFHQTHVHAGPDDETISAMMCMCSQGCSLTCASAQCRSFAAPTGPGSFSAAAARDPRKRMTSAAPGGTLISRTIRPDMGVTATTERPRGLPRSRS